MATRTHHRHLCVHQLFEQQVERTPDAIALILEDQQLTYQELNSRANQLAHYLIDLGVEPEVIVAVCLERSVELIVSLLAILKAGGAYLALDPSWPKESHSLLLKQASCSVLINQDCVTVLDLISPLGKPASGSPLAYVTFTSGSTGKPKGVAISHHSILRLVDPVNGFLLSGGHRVLQLAPVAFDAATLEIWGPLLNGGTSVVAPPERLSLPALAGILKKHNITTVWLTSGLFHAMVEAELAALAGVQQVLAGGDVLSAEHVQRLLDAFPSGHELINGYGPTENTTFTCCHHFEAAATVDTTGVSIGRPIANTEVRVLDEGNQPCPIGIPGELHIGGAGLARGYLNNPELTAEKFIPDPFSYDPTARLYKSGDLASWNPDGTLSFHGRIDQQIKLRGFRIEPGEIEASLLAHPAVAQAVVLLRHDDPNNPRLIAYWVADASQPTTSSASSEQLRAFLADRLPDYMVPAAFLQLEALPLTPNGKLDRKALPAPSFSGNLEQRLDPSTDLERQLHVIWAEVLGHSDFGITDNFFAVGGHSLAAANLVSRAEKTTGISISLAKLFQNPTISGLVDQLGKEKGEPQQDDLCCLIPLQPLGSRPPLVIVSGFGGGLFFEEGARSLAPHQPVYGLRFIGDLASMGCQSFETIISTFADLIVDFWRQGDVNLMGYSAGGWYAHALAAELLRRGRRIGALVIIDTAPNIRINRSLGARLLLDRLSQVRLRMHMRNLVREPTLEKRKTFIWDKMRTLKQAIEAYIGLRIPRPGVSLAKAMPAKIRPQPDFFVDLVRNSYRAAPLPITVAFLATPLTAQRYKRLWRHYTTRDLQTVVFYGEHVDVLRPDFQPKLALLIDNFLIGQQDGSC